MKAENLGILSAVLASSCCVIPLALVVLGLGSLGLGSVLGTYHWYLESAAVAVLAVAWWVFLREKRRLEGLAAEVKNERLTHTTLTFASLVVVLFLGMNLYAAVQASFSSPTAATQGGTVQAALTIPVEGMSCVTCEIPIEANLKKLPGVHSAKASSAQGTVIVHYDPLKVTVQHMAEAISAAGYRAKLPQS